MSNCVKLQKLNVQIFNLPEEIFRTIFSYLDANDLHSNLFNTCQQMRDYVTNYAEWEQTLILLVNGYQGIQWISRAMEAVHMIKFGGSKPHIYTKAAFPALPSQPDVSARLVFAATIQKRIVIGIDYLQCTNPPTHSNFRHGRFRKDLKYFFLEKDEWIRICRHKPEENQFATYDTSKDSKIKYSQIGESNIIMFYTEDRKDTKFIELLYFHKNEATELLNGTLTYSSYFVHAPEQIRSLDNFCLIEKTKYEFLVVGGIRQYHSDSDNDEEQAKDKQEEEEDDDDDEEEDEKEEDEDGEEKDEEEEYKEQDAEDAAQYVIDKSGCIFYELTVWSGCLSQDKKKIIWKDTGHKIPFMGHYHPISPNIKDQFTKKIKLYHSENHRCFCVGDNIYLSYRNGDGCGGDECGFDSLSYDRYDWEEKKYYRNVFSPSSLLNKFTGVPGNIDENKKLVLVAARMNHLMEGMGGHISIWFPVNRLYSKRQPLVFARYKSYCYCICNNCKNQCRNAIGSEANSIFFLPIVN